MRIVERSWCGAAYLKARLSLLQLIDQADQMIGDCLKPIHVPISWDSLERLTPLMEHPLRDLGRCSNRTRSL
jgi:hypothetical protein